MNPRVTKKKDPQSAQSSIIDGVVFPTPHYQVVIPRVDLTRSWSIEVRDPERMHPETRDLIASVRLRKTWFPLRVVARASDRWMSDVGRAVDLDIILHVPNAVSPESDDKMVTVASTTTVTTRGVHAFDFARIIRALIMKAILHEVDEQLMVGGRQLEDPHAADGKYDSLSAMFGVPRNIEDHERIMRESRDREARRLDAVFKPLRGLP